MPTNAKIRRVAVARRTPLRVTRRFSAFLYPRLRVTKNVVAPIGFTIAEIAVKVAIANVRSVAVASARNFGGQMNLSRALRAVVI